MLEFLIYLFVLGIIGWFTYKVYIWPYYISPLRKVPGPPSESLICGNFKAILLEEAGEPHIRWAKKYGTIVKFYGIFNKPSILVSDVKIIQEILLNNPYDYIKPPMADAIAIAGNGLVNAEGEDHKRQRKMMNPAFTHSNVKEMVPSFIRVASTLKGLIEDKVNAGESRINLTPYLSKATLDVIGLVGFNYEFNSLTSTNELAEAYDSITNTPVNASNIIFSILSNYFPYARKIPVKANKIFNNSCKVVDRISKRLIEEKYRDARNNKLNEKDLLSLLININKTLPVEEKMTDEELKYQIMTFLFTGHETTSVLLCWALYALAKHPHEQDLLREELVKAFPDKSKFNPTFEEINSLEYLNCVTKETLRLDSPAPGTVRLSTKDKFFGDYFIPKNTYIIIAAMALHRSPSIWGPTCDDFDPKRWLNPKDEFKSNFLPFLIGARSCIGNKVALNEFKVMLSMLIRNFVFQPVEGFHIRKKVVPVAKPDPHLELIVSRVEA